jgi:hypothetical protein
MITHFFKDIFDLCLDVSDVHHRLSKIRHSFSRLIGYSTPFKIRFCLRTQPISFA